LSKFILLRPAKLGQMEVLDGAILRGRTEEPTGGRMEEPNRGPDGARRGQMESQTEGQMEGQTEGQTRPDGVVNKRIIYF
jgi:hypothetical protein